jgi:thiol-disulfide isomerase/thioredoxin
MKVIFFLVLYVSSFGARAQHSFRLNENSVVKDSSGKIYSYAVWQGMLMGGGFDVKAEDPKDINTAFILVRLSAAEKEQRLANMPRPKESAFFTTGKKIDLFSTHDIDGNTIDLKEARGKIIVINFWFINCGPCRKEIPELNTLADSFKKDERILFLGIALDAKKDLENFLRQLPFKYTIVDDGRWIAGKYGIRFFPTHLILDREGKVYFHTSGLAPNTVHWIRKSIEELLAKDESL